MNDETLLKSHTMKVNKFVAIISMLESITCLVLAILSILLTYIPFLLLTISSFTNAILIYKKIHEKIIMLVLLIFLYVFLCILIMGLPNSVTTFIMLGLCFTTTYFRKWLVLIYGFFMSGVLIYSQIVKAIFSYQDFCLQLASILFSTACLFLLTKWGVELIKIATEKEEQANTLLIDLHKTMDTIKLTTLALNMIYLIAIQIWNMFKKQVMVLQLQFRK